MFWSFIELAKHRLGAEYGPESVLSTELLLSLNRASAMITYDLEAGVHRPRGWSWASFRLMFVIWLAGPLESKRVAELAGMTRAAVSNLSTPLETQGLLRKTADENDRRAVQLSLTEAGTARMRDVFSEQAERERAWTSALSEAEQRILVLLLNKLIGDRDGFEYHERR
ncbi:MarR family winged helix-turn-helix transcriptional regulator [Nocardia cyriacigeorgica]|uniref:MarR family winged helix-turn-helix transcriptional regulator n=1 Tax=Nocardia cyriacigeorgica TaxID=135487 RepID=UPI00245731FF|nr:MarR family transcriptional regulator [Nocardia cyriacigeorgica]